jgi:hypothetical protein
MDGREGEALSKPAASFRSTYEPVGDVATSRFRFSMSPLSDMIGTMDRVHE